MPVLRISSNYTNEELQNDLGFILPPRSRYAIQGMINILAKKAVEFRVNYNELAFEVANSLEELKELRERKRQLKARLRLRGEKPYDGEMDDLDTEIGSVQYQRMVFAAMSLKYTAAYEVITDYMAYAGQPLFWPEPTPEDLDNAPRERGDWDWSPLLEDAYDWKD